MYWGIPTQSTRTVSFEGYSGQKTRGLFYFAVLYQKHLANIDFDFPGILNGQIMNTIYNREVNLKIAFAIFLTVCY
jgi:hypothetical protein